jgi:hypothetical protein
MTHDPHPFSAATDKFAYAQAFSRDSRGTRENTATARDHAARTHWRLATLLHRH